MGLLYFWLPFSRTEQLVQLLGNVGSDEISYWLCWSTQQILEPSGKSINEGIFKKGYPGSQLSQ